MNNFPKKSSSRRIALAQVSTTPRHLFVDHAPLAKIRIPLIPREPVIIGKTIIFIGENIRYATNSRWKSSESMTARDVLYLDPQLRSEAAAPRNSLILVSESSSV